jgi:putative oxidoreductase
VSLLFGCYTRAGALVLTVYLAGLTLVLNNFWAYPVAEQPLQIAMCLKNLAIMGGLLNLLAYGPGPWSVDCKRLLDPRLARALSNEPNRSVLVEDDSIIV